MQIVYQGQPYDFDMADITVKQAIKIEKHLGCPISDFGDRLSPEDGKPADMMAIQCLGWLVLHGGKGVAIDDADFSLRDFMGAFGAALVAQREAEHTVPTVPAEPSVNGAAAAVPLTVP